MVASVPSNKELKLTKPGQIGASQLNSSVSRTVHMGLHDILTQPSSFFADFASRPASRSLALVPFLLLSLSKAYEPFFVVHGYRLGLLFLGVGLGWVANVLLFGLLWFHVAARVAGGAATRDVTLRGVGYAFFWPSLVGCAMWPLFRSAVADEQVANQILALGFVGASLVWAMVLAGIAVHHIHRLTWGRTIVVVLWFPIVYGGLILASILMSVEIPTE